jgi:endonuclease I/chitodextrinase
MKKTILFIALFSQLLIFAQIPANYYDTAIGLSGYQLKTQLRNIITNGHQNQGYNALYAGYVTTDSDFYYENDGTVLDMYSENPSGNDPYNYTHGNNQCGNQTAEGDCYNREHLMPQSWFGSASPMQGDIHHVVPTDGRVNNFRGHLPFGEVAVANFTSLNGSKRGSNAIAGYSGTVFEPIDEFKGDIARIYFYMATRYENEIASWENANDGSIPTFDGTSDHVFETWMLNMLISWHTNDPVSQREIDRNTAAYNFQGNANPYISHPEWVNTVWNPVPDNENPTVPTNLVASNISDTSVDLNWTASTDNVAVISYDVYRDGSIVGNSTSTSFSDSGLTPNTNYSYYVVAKDASLNESSNSNTELITTLNTPMSIFAENFNDCATVPNNFVTYNEASDKDWTCLNQFGENNSGAMQMNGFQEDVASKDWLITTNPIDFSLYTNERLSVYLIHTFGTMSLDLMYSTDYDGVSNPAGFTWNNMPNITIDTHNGTAQATTQIIANVDISALTQSAYVAFKYYSNGSPTRWTVDSFSIVGDNVAGLEDEIFSNSVVVYPNPTLTNSITVKADKTISNIKIYSIFGQLIKEIDAINTSEKNIQNLAKGIYLMNISSNKVSVIKKIIVL